MERNVDTTIQFSGLKSGRYNYSFALDGAFFSAFDNDIFEDGSVNFEVEMEKTERLLVFKFAFQGEVTTACDRCLGELSVEVAGEETLCVKFSDSEVSDDESVAILPEGSYQIDLAQWMYEYVVVAMPMQCVHPDDEHGNPTCDPMMMQYINNETPSESNEEIDPRWAALKDLK